MNHDMPAGVSPVIRMLGPGALSRLLLSLINPERIAGYPRIRVGNPDGDGGYVMVDAFGGIAGALSVGIGGDASWDLDVAGRGIDVFQYDHTVSGPPVSHDRFHFSPVGIAETSAPDRSFLSLDDMVAAIPGDGDVIAKVDAEGAEWAAFSSVSNRTMHRLAQIVIELHEPIAGDGTASLRHLAVLERIAVTHAVVHVHGNNYAGVRSHEGVRVPDVIETTWMRRAGVRFAPGTGRFPTTLDRPNDPERAEIAMSEVLRATPIEPPRSPASPA